MAKQLKKKEPQPKTRTPGRAVPAAGGMPAWLRRHGPWLGLLALALAVYWPALRAGFIWDDQAMSENPMMKSVGGLFDIWLKPSQNSREAHYWPLVYTTFWLEYRLWGLNPLGYHLVNVLLHGVCGVLVWRVLRRLGVPGAWLGAALFAVHPVHVESVAWVIERKDVLSGALYLGAALAYLKFAEHRSHKPYGSYGTYFLALVLFTLALLSKSIVVTLPVALGLIIWWKRGRLTRHDLLTLAPLVLITIVITLADIKCLRETPVIGIDVKLTLTERLRLAGQALWFYLGKLAWPWPLATLYPKWDVAAAGGLGGWLPLGAAAALAALLWALRRRLGRGPLVAALYFGLTLGPVLGLVRFGFMELAWAADRFQYLASIGPLALAAGGLTKLGMRNVECGMNNPQSAIRNPQSAFPIAASVLLVVLGVLAWRQAGYYENNFTLARHNAAVYPGNWAARYFYGSALEIEGDYAKAVAELTEAMRLAPDATNKVPYLLAKNLERIGRTEDAYRNFGLSVKLKPDDAAVRNEFGAFLADLGRNDEAIAQYQEALRINPQYADALSNLGSALFNQEKDAEALERFSQAAALRPEVAVYRYNIATALLRLGRQEQGIEALRETLRLNLKFTPAYQKLGAVLLERGAVDEAIQHLEYGVGLDPQDVSTHLLLGDAYLQKRAIPQAARHYEEALRLDPNEREAAAGLAKCRQAR